MPAGVLFAGAHQGEGKLSRHRPADRHVGLHLSCCVCCLASMPWCSCACALQAFLSLCLPLSCQTTPHSPARWAGCLLRCPAMPCYAIPAFTAILRPSSQCHAMPCHAMPCHAMRCVALRCARSQPGMHIGPTPTAAQLSRTSDPLLHRGCWHNTACSAPAAYGTTHADCWATCRCTPPRSTGACRPILAAGSQACMAELALCQLVPKVHDCAPFVHSLHQRERRTVACLPSAAGAASCLRGAARVQGH